MAGSKLCERAHFTASMQNCACIAVVDVADVHSCLARRPTAAWWRLRRITQWKLPIPSLRSRHTLTVSSSVNPFISFRCSLFDHAQGTWHSAEAMLDADSDDQPGRSVDEHKKFVQTCVERPFRAPRPSRCLTCLVDLQPGLCELFLHLRMLVSPKDDARGQGAPLQQCCTVMSLS